MEFYWGCLIFGVIFATAAILFGDILGNTFGDFFHAFSSDHLEWLQPAVVVGGVTIYGGTGLLLTLHTEFDRVLVNMFSLLAAIILSSCVYFLYIKPMRNCENSSGFFSRELIGKSGEVIVPISAGGFGEVLIKIGAGNTNQIAVSGDKVEIPAGTQVIVTDVKEGILYVSFYAKNMIKEE